MVTVESCRNIEFDGECLTEAGGHILCLRNSCSNVNFAITEECHLTLAVNLGNVCIAGSPGNQGLGRNLRIGLKLNLV